MSFLAEAAPQRQVLPHLGEDLMLVRVLHVFDNLACLRIELALRRLDFGGEDVDEAGEVVRDLGRDGRDAVALVLVVGLGGEPKDEAWQLVRVGLEVLMHDRHAGESLRLDVDLDAEEVSEHGGLLGQSSQHLVDERFFVEGLGSLFAGGMLQAELEEPLEWKWLRQLEDVQALEVDEAELVEVLLEDRVGLAQNEFSLELEENLIEGDHADVGVLLEQILQRLVDVLLERVDEFADADDLLRNGYLVASRMQV